MADILCPNCKKNNPDFLDVCQFCQTPLKPEAMVHTGEKPTKKNTGELEPILPEWLRDIRQQSKDSAQEESAHAAFQPKVKKNEPPDLLAGLASQAGRSDDDEVPDWLASLSPAAKPKPPAPPSSPEPETDFFAQFNKSKSEPAPAPVEKPAETNAPSQPSAEKDELSEWFSQASTQPAETIPVEPDAPQIEMGWMNNFDTPASPAQEPAPKEEEDLSWLRDLEASAKQTGDLTSPRQDIPAASQEDLSWLNNLGGISNPAQPSTPKEDLSWLNDLGGTSEPFPPPPIQPPAPKEDLSWLNNLGGTSEPLPPIQPSASKEDLSWLNDLGGTPEPLPPASFPSFDRAQDKPSAPKEDLSWLDNFGGTPEPVSPAPAPSSAPQEDLSWLNNLGGTSESSQPSSAKEEEGLGWLNNLGGTSEPLPPAPVQSSAPQEDLNWLNNLGGTPESASSVPAQSSTPQEDLSWLNNISGGDEPPSASVLEPTPETHTSREPDWLESMAAQSEDISAAGDMDALSPRHTAPLSGEAETTMPDWLKRASEEPSMPLGVEALDQFRETYQTPATEQPVEDPFAWMEPAQESQQEAEPLPSAPLPATIDSSLFAPTNDSVLSNQDVDSLLSGDMPDWLSRPEPSTSEVSPQETAMPTLEGEGGDTLAPVELPSWVQAMRPVEAVAESTPSVDDQPTEREGPLAGLRGLIPIAPIGSARRPKPISLKLQATDEQQASAALLEQILASETAPRTIVDSSLVTSQNVLRWTLSGLMLIALSSMIFLRTQTMPVSPALLELETASSAVANIPENSHVLVVIDYEPSLAGEMEAASGPLLDQIVLSRHPRLSFLSMSPNGSALAERLMTNSNINRPSPDGLGYNAGEHYFNLGYLPGGAAGVLEFVTSPQMAMPSSGVTRLSDFSGILVLTDHAESGRVWVEQLQSLRQTDPLFPTLANQPLLMVSSAQAGPLLQPYVSSGQITGMINGLADAARYEFVNNSRPGIARAYWDTFGVGLILAISAITLGSLWSLFTGIRARRAEAEG